MATKTVKKSNILDRVDTLKNTAGNIHDEALQLTDNLVDSSLSTGAKWQKLFAKALNQGTVLFEKQQDLALTTLEEMKGQMIRGNKRFRKLFNMDDARTAKSSKTKKTTKKVNAKTAASAKSDITKDDLRQIEGIGPKIQILLNQAGILTFTQLAETSITDLNTILEAAGPRYKMHDPKTWRVQAKRLMKK